MASHPFLHPKPISAHITAEDVADCRNIADLHGDIANRYSRMASYFRKLGDRQRAEEYDGKSMQHTTTAAQWEYEANDMESMLGN